MVIVSCHIGAEGESRSAITRADELFLGENRGNPYAFAHAAVDAGADIVFCHGPHIPRAIEVYRGRFIAYSLGNFWTYGRFSLRGSSHAGADRRARSGPRRRACSSARIVSARQDRPGGPVLRSRRRRRPPHRRSDRAGFPRFGISIAEDGTVRWREACRDAGRVTYFSDLVNSDVSLFLAAGIPQGAAIFLERERVEAVLLLEHAGGEAVGVVAGQDLHLAPGRGPGPNRGRR